MSRNYLALALALTAASWAAIFIKYCSSAPLVIASYRMGLVSLIMLPLYLLKRDKAISLSARDLAMMALSGFFLAAHFASWITGLAFTSISSATVLVTVQPLFLTMLAQIILKERVDSWGYLAIFLALAGAVCISWGDFQISGQSLVGDLLALAGALFAAGYLLIGRSLIVRVGLLNYIYPVYVVSAVMLIVAALIAGNSPTPASGRDYVWFILLALVPTLLGHTFYNYALKRLKTHLVGITMLGEPVLTTVWAYLLFRDHPAITTFIGAAMIFSAITFTFRHEAKVSA